MLDIIEVGASLVKLSYTCSYICLPLRIGRRSSRAGLSAVLTALRNRWQGGRR
jgi:hypothetical protein